MKIAPEKGVLVNAILLYALTMLAAVLFYFQFGHMIVIDLFLAVCLWIDTKYWIAFGRTITLDKNGITIMFLGITRTYSWSHFSLIASYNSRNLLEYKPMAFEGIEIVPKKNKRIRFLSPATYCLFFHPFTYVFLSYSESVVQPKVVKYPVLYQVKRDEIKAVLASFNVSLSD